MPFTCTAVTYKPLPLESPKESSCRAEGRACLAAEKQLVVGECLPFMAEFQMKGPALAKMSDAAFRQAIAIGPTPTDQCCRDAKAFVTQVSVLLTFECMSAAGCAVLCMRMQSITRSRPSLQHGRAEYAELSAPKEKSLRVG